MRRDLCAFQRSPQRSLPVRPGPAPQDARPVDPERKPSSFKDSQRRLGMLLGRLWLTPKLMNGCRRSQRPRLTERVGQLAGESEACRILTKGLIGVAERPDAPSTYRQGAHARIGRTRVTSRPFGIMPQRITRSSSRRCYLSGRLCNRLIEAFQQTADVEPAASKKPGPEPGPWLRNGVSSVRSHPCSADRRCSPPGGSPGSRW